LGSVRVKICGVTNVGDAEQAVALGADALGLNFYPASLRCISVQVAREIVGVLPPFVQAVGVFVNQSLEQVTETLSDLAQIRLIQWHGDSHLVGDWQPFQWIAGFSVSEQRDLLAVSHYLDLCRNGGGQLPAAVLVDARVTGMYGGTGQLAPWGVLAGFQPGLPLILAGGLDAENVAEAIRLVHPYAVDVASGVESSPGRKDPEKMRRFIGTAREAAAKYGV